MRFAVAFAVLRLLLDVSVHAALSTSSTAAIIYGSALQAVVAVYAIVTIILFAKQYAARQAPVVS